MSTNVKLFFPQYTPSLLPALLMGGLDYVYEYNGFVMGEYKKSYDLVRITEVAGMEDADIRDLRMENAGRDGETAFDAFYGGRTLAFTGRIESGNYAMWRSLCYNMNTAFNGLTELPLGMWSNDWFERFDQDLLRTAFWALDAGSLANIAVTGGVLTCVASGGTEERLYHPLRTWEDQQGQLKFKTPTAIGAFQAGIMLKRQSSTVYMKVYVDDDGSNSRLRIDRVSGTTTNVASVNLPSRLATLTTYWIRGRIEGDVVTADFFTSAPPAYNVIPSPTATLSANTGANVQFGPGAKGNTGIVWIPNNTTATLDDYEQMALSPFDPYVLARKSQPIQRRDKQSDMRYMRDFLLTLRASDPRLFSKFWKRGSQTVTVISTLGRVYNRTYDLQYASSLDATQNPSSTSNGQTVTNLGNYYTSPVIRINGDVTNPTIINYTTGEQMAFAGNIPAGDYWEIDTRKRTVKSGGGVNKFGNISGSYDWLRLAPGANSIDLLVSAFSASPTYQVFHQHAWL